MKEENPSTSADTENANYQPRYELVDASQWKQALEAQHEVTSIREKATRFQAELENTRKRLEREKDEALRYANSSLLESLLPVIDNFELGLQAADTATDAQSIAMGMKMVKTQLEKFLEENGVQTIEAVGKEFDPNRHDAVSQQETQDHPEGSVIEQSRKGYTLHDRLLRPASVVVAQAPSEQS